MSYFITNYGKVRLPIASDDAHGLRNAQLGAIHSIASYFTINDKDPALIVMPTGSGKTAVLILAAYLLRAKRVLVISSSVMVRGQIVDEFESLITLSKIGVLPAKIKPPKILEIKSPIKSSEEWNAMQEYDVVIGIPNSINVGINEDFRPAEDLFDIVLVDEAHHVPAFTWSRILKHFHKVKKIYFTATPFRRDRKDIGGNLVYNYPLTKAYEDKIFGKIGYYPVITDGGDIDKEIAKETEKVFKSDKDAGLKHYIMVRTETKDEAEKLDDLYKAHTELRLKRVDSTLTYRTIKKTIEKLRNGELDGIICVDMLGEGFDFPNLKIAAIHSPKKSLSTTLQFIGRFARTNAENIGEAKFLAEPNDIRIGKQRLYEEGAIWNDIIRNLSEGVIEEENEIKRTLDTFEKEKAVQSKEEISFYNLNPYCHVKVYNTAGINMNEDLDIQGHEIVCHAKSIENKTILFVTKETEKPKWISTDDILNVQHYFFLLIYDEETKLLFIHSSIKSIQFYDWMVKKFAIGDYQRIPKYQLHKVLADINDPEFFNIGMQNRSAHSGESYRIIAGPNAENTIKKNFSRNYANGHMFMKGVSEGDNITIGYSSGSKVWSNAYQKIPEYIKWCKSIGAKIVSNKEVKTNTGYDNLPIGRVIESLPFPALSAVWNHDTFQNAPFIVNRNGGELQRQQLLDFEISIDKTRSSKSRIIIYLENDERCISLTYDFKNHFQYEVVDDNEYRIEDGAHETALIDYLNENPLTIYLEDFASVANHEYFEPTSDGEYQYDIEKIQSFDWVAKNTDIEKEYYNNDTEKKSNGGRESIHETLYSKLSSEAYSIIFYDHGTGEIADYITMREETEKVEVVLYHVKGSSSGAPGNRVGDLYEVCMQAVKSQAWTINKQAFKKNVERRIKGNPQKMKVGDMTEFNRLINLSKRIEFAFAIVQPGISRETIVQKLTYIIAAADDSLTNNGYQPLIVIGS